MATITISAERTPETTVKPGTRCCHRLMIAKRGKYRGSGASAKAYSFGRAKSGGRCPNAASTIVKGKPYCTAHARSRGAE